MSSSETMDSGNFPTPKNFSQTCSLLSQYLKENGSFGNLNLSLSANFQPHGGLSNLATQQQTSGGNGEAEKSQLTIFYGGQVIVVDEFPADKVKEIVAMAGVKKSSSVAAANLVPKSSFGNNLVQQSLPVTPQPLINDLPIARKASLAIFLEKRKDRITAKAPYQTDSMGATSKPGEVKGKPWLGLGAHPPAQVEHQV